MIWKGIKLAMNVRNVMYIFNDVILGGAGRSLIDTITKIKDCVNPIVVIRDDAEVEDQFMALNIQYYKLHFTTDFVEIGNKNKNMEKQNFISDYEAAVQLLQIIEEEKVQLIHINSSVSNIGAMAALMAHIPYVWHIRELMEEQFGCEFLNEELKCNLYARADKLISISDYVKQKYLERYHIHTLRIYNGLNVEKYKLKVIKDTDYQNVFLVVAMISHEKGQWDAICATEILIKAGYSDVQLIVVGDGNDGYIWALKKYISMKKLDRNIFILPYQNDLSKLNKKASYAITCSQNEALGRVTIEAMLAGNVVIGARSGGTVEIIGENEERGFLYELHNSKDLANTMIRAMNCPKEIKNQMIESAQIYAEKAFDAMRYCKTLIEVYNEAISSFEADNKDVFLNELKKYYIELKNEKLCEKQNAINTQYLKLETAFSLAIKWLEIKQKGYNLSEYFRKNDIQTIAIYGMSYLGCRLYDELENGDIEVRYLLDRKPNKMDSILEFGSLDGEKLLIDAIVVTVALTEKQVINEIKQKGYQKVVGLSEVLDSFMIPPYN